MHTPGEPTSRNQAIRPEPAAADHPRATYEFAQHIGKSLALLGVMLVFLSALLAAEGRELHAWRMHSLREATRLSVPSSATADADARAAHDALLEGIDAQGMAMRELDRAVFVACIGVALAALALVLRRGNRWFIAVTLVLACLVMSTQQFTVAHAQLSHADYRP